MVRGRRRRATTMAFGVVGVIAAMGATAFACTTYRGRFLVTGSEGGTVKAQGQNSGMTYCPGSPMGTASASAGGTITVWTRKLLDGKCGTTAAERTDRLPANRYDINFLNGPAHLKSPDRDGQLDCMSGGTEAGVTKLGEITVNDRGAGGPKTFTLPSTLIPNGPNDESAVCISDAGGAFGNQVPLTIL